MACGSVPLADLKGTVFCGEAAEDLARNILPFWTNRDTSFS
jgi:hypothetical protein